MYAVYMLIGPSPDGFLASIGALGYTYLELFTGFWGRVYTWILNFFTKDNTPPSNPTWYDPRKWNVTRQVGWYKEP